MEVFYCPVLPQHTKSTHFFYSFPGFACLSVWLSSVTGAVTRYSKHVVNYDITGVSLR